MPRINLRTVHHDHLTQLVPSDVLSRGKRCFRQGAVLSVACGYGMLQARVQGSDGKPYQVTIQEKGAGSLASACTCPYAYNYGTCKHAVAALLAWMAQRDIHAPPAPVAAVAPPPPAPRPVPARAALPPGRGWYPQPSDYEVVLDEDLDEDEEWGGGDSVIEALACGREWDVIVLDITLPGLSGLDVLARIQELEPVRRPAVIVISGHGTVAVSTSTVPADQSTWDVGTSTCRVLGSTPARMACTILISPAVPAAAWVWPMFDLTVPSSSGWSPARSRPSRAARSGPPPSGRSAVRQDPRHQPPRTRRTSRRGRSRGSARRRGTGRYAAARSGTRCRSGCRR